MSNLRETYRSTRQWFDKQGERRNPDGIGFAFIGSQIICAPLVGVQLFVAREMHEIANEIDANLAKFLVIAGLGIINGLSVLAETKAISKNEYSASIITNIANSITDRPLPSALISKTINYGLLAATNPINLYALVTGNSQFYMESTIAGSFIFSSWSIIANRGIASRFSTPLTERIKKGREKIGNKLNQPLHNLWDFIREE